MAYKLIYNGGNSLVDGILYPYIHSKISYQLTGMPSGGLPPGFQMPSNRSNWYKTNELDDFLIPYITNGTILADTLQSTAVSGFMATTTTRDSYVVIGPFNFTNFIDITAEINSVDSEVNVSIGYIASLPSTLSDGIIPDYLTTASVCPLTSTSFICDTSTLTGSNYIVIKITGSGGKAAISKIYLQYKNGIILPSHRTKKDGTSYIISGGKTLIAGTSHALSKGTTLINGTSYDILLSIKTWIYNRGTSLLEGTFYAFADMRGAIQYPDGTGTSTGSFSDVSADVIFSSGFEQGIIYVPAPQSVGSTAPNGNALTGVITRTVFLGPYDFTNYSTIIITAKGSSGGTFNFGTSELLPTSSTSSLGATTNISHPISSTQEQIYIHDVSAVTGQKYIRLSAGISGMQVYEIMLDK